MFEKMILEYNGFGGLAIQSFLLVYSLHGIGKLHVVAKMVWWT